jgi:hypothetical protein
MRLNLNGTMNAKWGFPEMIGLMVLGGEWAAVLHWMSDRNWFLRNFHHPAASIICAGIAFIAIGYFAVQLWSPGYAVSGWLLSTAFFLSLEFLSLHFRDNVIHSIPMAHDFTDVIFWMGAIIGPAAIMRTLVSRLGRKAPILNYRSSLPLIQKEDIRDSDGRI